MNSVVSLAIPYVAALWRGRWTVMVIAWLLCLAGWIYVALQPNTYTAKARMFVDTDTLLKPLMQDLAVTPNFDRQVGVMRDTLLSGPNIEEVIARTGIGERFSDPLARVDLIQSLADKLYIDIQGHNLFEIGYTHPDPDIAYNVVSSMLDIFVQQQLGHSQRDVEIAGEFIDEQIASYDEKLRAAELRLAEFQKEHAEELGGAERNVRDLERTEAEIRRLRSELDASQWRLDQLRAKLDSTPRTVSGSQAGATEISPAQQQLRELNNELTRKLLLYTEQHPDIVALRQLITQANEQVKAEGEGSNLADITVPNPLHGQLTNQVGVIEVTIDDLERRLVIAENEGRALNNKIRQAPEVEADLKRLNRDYNVLLTQYDQLTERRESAHLARSLDEGKKRIEFRTIEPPVRPLQPSGPPHGLFMIAVLLLGTGFGCAFIIGRFIISDTVMTSSQLQNAFPGFSVLGGVSEVRPSGMGNLPGHFGFVGSGAALLAMFVTFFYFYQLSPEKPDLGAIAADLTKGVLSKNAQAEP